MIHLLSLSYFHVRKCIISWKIKITYQIWFEDQLLKFNDVLKHNNGQNCIYDLMFGNITILPKKPTALF